MPKNEEGEFELVVGNKQLLSIVFILFVLFGVVFSMGYFVGRNSAPEAAPGRQAAEAPSQPRPAPGAEPAARPAPSQTQAPPAADAALQPGEAKVMTSPVAAGKPESDTAGSSAQPPAAPEAQRAAETQRPGKPVEPPASSVPESSASNAPQLGQVFLQVAAVKRPEAELIVDVLKKRGFRALVAPVLPGQPEDALWRALVGPLRDAADVARTRADLQAAGFKEVIVRKY